MYADKRNKEEMHVEEEIQIAFQILQYNQGLVQFADSKANALLLINSIFIASMGPFLGGIKSSGANASFLLVLIFFATSICSILLALGVISTRKVYQINSIARSPIFYGHIVDSKSSDAYFHEMTQFDAKDFHYSLLQNVYVVAKIASTKFSIYNYGQNLTILSCLFWIVSFISFLQ